MMRAASQADARAPRCAGSDHVFTVRVRAAVNAATPTRCRVVTLPHRRGERRARAERACARSLTRARARRAIVQRNSGLDTPMLLATHARRLRVLRRGQRHRLLVPLDPRLPAAAHQRARERRAAERSESHEVYWIDHPDLLASTSRGAGAARRRLGALRRARRSAAASNLETAPFSRRAADERVAIGYGSYDTKRADARGSTRGRSPAAGTCTGATRASRASAIATSRGRSCGRTRCRRGAGSAAPVAAPESLRRARRRRTSPISACRRRTCSARSPATRTTTADSTRSRIPNERDHFFEPHYELVHTWSTVAERSALTQTLFYVRRQGLLRRATLRPRA